ncbi:MAG TPA: CdaR family protein [Chloroflexota bacterium]|nr:CdaR family protein [Chloroflexota bacterium]
MRINFGLGALALIISLSLWVLVVNDQNPERTDVPEIAIPVETTRVSSGLIVMNTPDPVRFRIKTPKDKWDTLRASSFRAYVDLSRLGPGIHAVPIISETSDPQVRVLEVMPATTSIRVEEIQERTVPVKVTLVGNVPFGYVYRMPKVDPEVVVASGPSSLVQSVETASVDVRLEGISVDIDTAFHPAAVDSSGATVRIVRLDPQTVRVSLPVSQQVSYKQVGVRATTSGAVAPGYWTESVSVDPSSVTVVGDPKALASINYLETAPLNVDGASSSIVQDLRINTTEGVSLVQQQTTRVRVQISPLQTSQVLRVAPRLVNLAPRLQVVSAPASVEVTVQGPAPIMQGLRVESVSVTLDVKDLSEGTHTVKVNASVPSGLSVAKVDPETAAIQLAPPATPTAVAQPTVAATATPTATLTATPGVPR